MSTPTFPGPFHPEALTDHAPVLAALAATGYTREALIRLGLVGQESAPLGRALARSGGEARGDLSIMIRLWMTAEPIPAGRVEQALGAGVVASLVACGLLAADGDSLRATACLLPMQSLWTIRDFDPREVGGEMHPDHVPSISLSTALVANFTVRTRARLGLDLGCGSGYQAMRLAMHCDRVIATDINTRCLNFAAMSMKLNGVTNVDLRHGSLFEPVEGLRFDAIASNPPFVISPGSELVFRDSGLPGDQVSERLIRRFAEILDEGGWATVLFNWHHRTDGTWADRPRDWIAGRGCDGWLVRLRTDEPEDYARAWILTGQGGVGEPDPAKVREWTEYYRAIGAEAMSLAALIIRRRSGGPANWFRVDLPDHQDEMDSASDQVVRIFEGETALRGPQGDAGVLDLRLRLAAAARLEQTRAVRDREWAPAASRLVLTDGLRQTTAVAPMVADFIAWQDGRFTVRDLARGAAGAWDVQPEQAESSVTPVMAKLLRAGYFEVVRA